MISTTTLALLLPCPMLGRTIHTTNKYRAQAIEKNGLLKEDLIVKPIEMWSFLLPFIESTSWLLTSHHVKGYSDILLASSFTGDLTP